MIVLADNDIVHKLACCDLLPELMQWLEAPPNEVWVLPTLLHVIRRKLKANPPALACLEVFMQSTQCIPSANPEHIARFPGLDVGELQMLAVFVDSQFDCNRLVTGDKRALRLIAEFASYDTDLHRRLNGRVDCLEGIMLGLIDRFGFDAINAKVIQGIEVDGLFRLAFGRHRNCDHAREAITSYLDGLRQEAQFVAG